MNSGSYEIVGGDYEHGGSASSGLKEWLKKVGARAHDVRRAMIAAYEAEMNVVIHAHKGRMRFTLDPGQLDVEVRDEGPGIPDIERAMEEGFSTAPPRARELGFGAGLGLPNIRKNSDRFSIESRVGLGTQVRFTIFLKPQATSGVIPHSVRVIAEACRGCMACVRVCPTRALRIRSNRPVILEHLCIDCTACMQACASGAITVPMPTFPRKIPEGTRLVVPTGFLSQFGPGGTAERVLAALNSLGFAHVSTTQAWDLALRRAVIEYARQEAERLPVISPVCGAVVNLIETRFPSLMEHVAPFLTPIEAARDELSGHSTVFVAGCPFHHTALVLKDPSASTQVMDPVALRREVLPMLLGGPRELRPPPPGRMPSGRETEDDVLEVTGVGHVVDVLEAVENGLLNDVGVLELFVCDQGCFGSPFLSEDPFVARYRWRGIAGMQDASATAVRRRSPLVARPGLRLDADMSQAIAKLAKIEDVTRTLGGKNCGLCGSPTCSALAEDIVLNRAAGARCRRLSDRAEDEA